MRQLILPGNTVIMGQAEKTVKIRRHPEPETAVWKK